MRKMALFILIVLGMTATAGAGCSRDSLKAKRTSGEGQDATHAIIGVEELMAGPERFTPPLSVRGIVGKILPGKGLFSLVDLSDREELLQTGSTQCVTLPVQWTGPMPALKEDILVSGEIRRMDGKLIFVSSKVERVAGETQN